MTGYRCITGMHAEYICLLVCLFAALNHYLLCSSTEYLTGYSVEYTAAFKGCFRSFW